MNHVFDAQEYGNWRISPYIDEDGHLNISIKSFDGTPIEEIRHETFDDGTMELRFTSEQIEKDYKKMLEERI